MADRPNFVLVPEAQAPSRPAAAPPLDYASRFAVSVGSWLSHRAAAGAAPEPTSPAAWSGRARLVFGFDATASREPAWAAARDVTDALVWALPGELDVALAVHGVGRLHTFTDFTADPNRLRDQAATIPFGIVPLRPTRHRRGRDRLRPSRVRRLGAGSAHR